MAQRAAQAGGSRTIARAATPAISQRQKSAKLQALASARKAISSFSGELAEPIVVVVVEPQGMLALADYEANKRRFAKVDALLNFYGIKANDRMKWFDLSMRLAFDFVPGMQVVKRQKTKRGPKEKRNWTEDKLTRLVAVVDSKRKNDGIKIDAAVADLVKKDPKQWGSHWPSVVARYHEGKTLIRIRNRPRKPTLLELWKKGRNMPDRPVDA
jgi:hypothetical protein